jgi:putative IMPACT (imprinted ancient) family translation regulator
MKWFVSYEYDYESIGGKGFRAFDSEEQALAFIQHHMSENPNATLDCFGLVKGQECEIRATVTKIVVA